MKLHEAVAYIYAIDELSCSEQSVLIALCFRAGLSGECWPSISRIASDSRVATSSVSRSLKSLISKGLISVSAGTGRKSSMYYMWYSLSYHSGATTAHGGATDGNTDGNTDEATESCVTTVTTQGIHGGATTAHSGAQTDKENNTTTTKDVVDRSQSITREEKDVPLHQAQPLDVWVSDIFEQFGFHLSVPVAQHMAARILSAMDRSYAEIYVSERLCELTGQPQAKVIKYILQDGPEWLKRKLNPPPAKEAKYASKPKRERVIDPGVRSYIPQVEDDFWAYSPEEVAANKARTAARLAAEAAQNQEVK